jgi:hypothetical protein
MAKDRKKKLGLQKDVSSIFKGVPIPQKNAGDKTRQTPDAPTTGRTRNIPALERTIGSTPEPKRKGDISEPQRKSDIPEPKREVQIPAKPKFEEPRKSKLSLIKKINQPTQLLRKDTPIKQLVVDANKKAAKSSQWQQVKNTFFAPKPGTSPTKQKATAALIPVLAFVFIFVLRQVFWTAPRRIEGALENDKPGAAATINTSNEIDWQIPALFPSSLRDPMKLNSSENEQSDEEEPVEIIELNINGILHSEDNPSVLIDDRIMHEGEKISGVTIVKINKNSIEFEMNGTKWEQSVRKQTEAPNREVLMR